MAACTGNFDLLYTGPTSGGSGPFQLGLTSAEQQSAVSAITAGWSGGPMANDAGWGTGRITFDWPDGSGGTYAEVFTDQGGALCTSGGGDPTPQTIQLILPPALNLTPAEGFELSMAILGVWVTALGMRALIRTLRGYEDND